MARLLPLFFFVVLVATVFDTISMVDGAIARSQLARDHGAVAVSLEILTHPTKKDVFVVVSKATDEGAAVVKNVYDSEGRMIDCDVNMDADEAGKLLRGDHEVDNDDGRRSHGTTATDQQRSVWRKIRKLDSTMSVLDQVDRCQTFLQARIDLMANAAAEAGQQSVAGMPVEIDVEEEQENAGRGARSKRSYLIWPGTNWCGKGSKAEFAESFGENVATDKCCQKHDQCPYIIEGFTTKYNLFNYRIHTLSVCDCDKKFMDCLKSSNTSTSTMVGKVYFNVVNTECFDMKLQKTCSKRSWWGGCEKYKTKWAATVRSLGAYPE